MSAQYSGLFNLPGGEITQDPATGEWVVTTPGSEGSVSSVPLSSLMNPQDWANFQSAMQQGLISYQPGQATGGENSGYAPGQFQLNYSALPRTVLGAPASMIGSGAVNILGTDPNQRPTGDFVDPSKITWDPNYGWLDPASNVQKHNTAFDNIMTAVGNAMPAVIASGMGAITLNPALLGAQFAGGGLGALGSGLFKAAGSTIEGNQLSPTSLIGPAISASGISLPGIGSTDYTPPTSGGNMDLTDLSNWLDSLGGAGDPGGIQDFTSGLIPNMDGTFTDPATGIIYDSGGLSTGMTDPQYGGAVDNAGLGIGGGGGGGAVPAAGGLGSSLWNAITGSGSASGLPFGMSPQQLLGLGLGVGGALYGSSQSKAAANQIGQAAQQQAAANLNLARTQSQLNNPNMNTPYGTSTYTTGPDGRPILTQTLSPQEQAKLTATERLQQNALGLGGNVLKSAAGVLGRPFGISGNPIMGFDPRFPIGNVTTKLDLSGAPPMPVASDAVRQQAQDAAYANQTQYLDPQFAIARKNLETQLSNQGIMPGTQAYNDRMLAFNNQQQKAYDSARQEAVTQGLQAQTAQFGMGLGARQQGVNEAISGMGLGNQAVGEQAGIAGQSTQLANAGRGQAFGEYTTGQQLPISQLSQLLAASPILNPQFQGTQPTSIATAPYFQAGTAQANLGQGNTQNLFNLIGRFGSGYMNQPGGNSYTSNAYTG